MDVLNNYKNYRQYLPEYESWAENQDLKNAKRVEYLKRNPDKINQEDILRGKNLLHAIDVMDEYSQSYAEDTEVATEMAASQVVGLTTTLGMMLGGVAIALKPVQKFLNKISKGNKVLSVYVNMLPSLIGMTLGTIVTFPVLQWATKAKIGASRKGRFEAMNKDLKNPNIFAVLTPEQQKQVDELAKDIVLEDKDKKRLQRNKGFNFNPAQSFKTLKELYQGDEVYKQRKLEFETKLKENETNFDKKLTDTQITQAKRDQQILAKMVRKIDIASQDYAENTELSTNTITTLALGTGGLVGWVSNKILKGLKIKGGVVTQFVPWAIGLSIPLGLGIYAANIQKQASRIARFKVKQELLNNPAELVYVEDKDIENITDVKLPEKTKKPNIFKFMVQLIKDNKEYQKYLKTEGPEQLKRSKVIDKIELSEEQLRQAKNLQMNVFKTFNKVDEKSQTYSESVEAVGSFAKQITSTIGTLVALGIQGLLIAKLIEKQNSSTKNFFSSIMKTTIPVFALAVLPILAIDIITTKAQKKASRVADMLALKDLEDYRHYADYSEEKNTIPEIKNSNETNLIKRFQV